MATARAPKQGQRRAGTKKKERKSVPHGVASIAATFNNTIVAISDPVGNILAWSSAGRIGLGRRRRTRQRAQAKPWLATVAKPISSERRASSTEGGTEPRPIAAESTASCTAPPWSRSWFTTGSSAM